MIFSTHCANLRVGPIGQAKEGEADRFVQFVQGRYETSDKAEVAALKALAPLVEPLRTAQKLPAPKAV